MSFIEKAQQRLLDLDCEIETLECELENPDECDCGAANDDWDDEEGEWREPEYDNCICRHPDADEITAQLDPLCDERRRLLLYFETQGVTPRRGFFHAQTTEAR